MIKVRADVIAGIVSTLVLCGASGWIWWKEPQRLSTGQLMAAVSKDPKNAEAFTELANRQEHDKQFEAAMQSYLGAGKAGMGANSYAKAARCALKAGKFGDAQSYARDAVDMDAGSKVGTAATIAAGVFVELGETHFATRSFGAQLNDIAREFPNHITTRNPGRQRHDLPIRRRRCNRECYLKQMQRRIHRHDTVTNCLTTRCHLRP